MFGGEWGWGCGGGLLRSVGKIFASMLLHT